jgi:hypothetical protein
MLIVVALACAAVTAWGFVALYGVSRREERPHWLFRFGAFEVIVPVLIAGLVFAVMLPILFLQDYAAQRFDVLESILSAAAVLVGIAGVFAIHRRNRRLAQHRSEATPRPNRAVPKPSEPPAGTPTGPKPASASGSRRRRAA